MVPAARRRGGRRAKHAARAALTRRAQAAQPVAEPDTVTRQQSMRTRCRSATAPQAIPVDSVDEHHQSLHVLISPQVTDAHRRLTQYHGGPSPWLVVSA